jgi:dsDNA-binding SOS-regulon protein
MAGIFTYFCFFLLQNTFAHCLGAHTLWSTELQYADTIMSAQCEALVYLTENREVFKLILKTHCTSSPRFM